MLVEAPAPLTIDIPTFTSPAPLRFKPSNELQPFPSIGPKFGKVTVTRAEQINDDTFAYR